VLSPHSNAKELIAAARSARTPSPRDRSRVYRKLGRALAGLGLVGAATGATAGENIARASWMLWAKWSVPVALVISTAAAPQLLTQFHRTEVLRNETATAAPSNANASIGAPAVRPPAVALADTPLPDETAPPSAPTQSATKSGPKTSPDRQPKESRQIVPVDDLGGDASLLRQAYSAWRNGDAPRALELATNHAIRFPKSQLRSERDGLRVLALCALDRTSEARRVAKSLAVSAPASPVLARLADSCVGRE
jgi:hypothetical protein